MIFLLHPAGLNRSSKRAPPGARLLTAILAPGALTISMTIASPSPAPSVVRPLPRQKRSKMRGRSSTGMLGPLSRTASARPPPRYRQQPPSRAPASRVHSRSDCDARPRSARCYRRSGPDGRRRPAQLSGRRQGTAGCAKPIPTPLPNLLLALDQRTTDQGGPWYLERACERLNSDPRGDLTRSC
jgi:hypothetical protein